MLTEVFASTESTVRFNLRSVYLNFEIFLGWLERSVLTTRHPWGLGGKS